MNSPTHAKSASNEAQIQLALQAIQQDASLTVRRAAKLYNVPRSTLGARRDCRPMVTRLTVTEEEVIIRHILELDSREFSPRLAALKDMADSLVAARHCKPVGINWLASLVKRTPELAVKFNRKYV